MNPDEQTQTPDNNPTIITPQNTTQPEPGQSEVPHVIEAAPIQEEKIPVLKRIFSASKIITFVIFCLVIVVMTNLYVLQVFKVDGDSMHPTLKSGDTMLLWKLPRTWSKITKKQYIPKRWDIIVVRNRTGEQYIKRVIGLPGERVVISNGQVTVYNRENPKGFNPDENECCSELANTAGDVNRIVNDGELFVMGDNREPAGSIDSRSGLGNVPASEIVGKAKVRLLSPLTIY